LDRIQKNSEVNKISSLEEEEAQQMVNFKRDMLGGSKLYVTSDIQILKNYFNEVANRTSRMDLKSYDFSQDPDCKVLH